MCTEAIQLVDSRHSPTLSLSQRSSCNNTATAQSPTIIYNDRKFSTNTLTDEEPVKKVSSLPAPKGRPRASSELISNNTDFEIKIEHTKPIFTHKLPDDFFTSCSPPSPISPIEFFTSSKTNSPISSPHIHPTANKACPVEPIEKLTTKKDDVLLPPSFLSSVPNRYNLTQHTHQHSNKHRLSLDDFVIKQTVGTGSFSRVHLAKSKINNKYYAIKAINKKDLVSRRQVEHAHNERDILGSVSHPFLVKLWGTFQSETHVFLVTDYVPGGELFRIIRKYKKLNGEAAKFYAAEVLLAIEHLHANDIAYRDLKPENILIDHRGHVKLTDFGFAKRVPDMTWTVCGTPDYLAPEIIRSQGYTKAVDWWSLGVLIYEMLTGRPPFTAKNPIDQYQKILNCDIDWPEDMSPDAKDLLQNLLKTKASERFGNLKDGANDIKNHPWFQSLDFDQVKDRRLSPPYVPDLKFAGDTHCFDYYEEIQVPYGMIQTDESYSAHFANF